MSETTKRPFAFAADPIDVPKKPCESCGAVEIPACDSCGKKRPGAPLVECTRCGLVICERCSDMCGPLEDDHPLCNRCEFERVDELDRAENQ